jgi:hypothetical protein
MAKISKEEQRKLADVLFPSRADRDVDGDVLSVPLNERRLQTETYDFTISTIHDLLRDDRIVVPDFQRRYVWTRSQASKLIESLIIQCPIPVIYLDQEDDGTLKVVDGNQRLMSVKLYLDNGFRLQGLTAFPDLNGLYYRDLEPRFKNQILNRTIRCITILKETHPQIKFDVFERLNTGAVQLNPQELRHGLYYGPLMDLLDELGQYGTWKKITGIRSDKRMRGAELIIRYLALTYELEKYEKPLATFLNNFARDNRRAGNADELSDSFKMTVDGVHELLGDNAFRLFAEDGAPDNNVNAAVFDAQMVGFARSEVTRPDVNAQFRKRFRQEYIELQKSPEFLRSVTASTSDPPLVRYRIAAVRNLLNSLK